MADREVTFRINVDSGGGARSVDKLADSARGAGKAADDAEKQFRRMNATAADGGRGGGRAGAAGAGGTNDTLAAYFRLEAVTRSLTGALKSLGDSLAEMGTRTVTVGQTIRTVARGFLEALPFGVGTLVQAAGALPESLSGVSAYRASNLAFGARYGATQQEQAAEFGLRTGAAGELAGFGRTARNAALEAAGARSFAAGLTPGALGLFRSQTPVFGVRTGEEGPLAFAAAQAEAAAGVAERQAAAERAAFVRFRGGLGLTQLGANAAAGAGAIPGLIGRAQVAGQVARGDLLPAPLTDVRDDVRAQIQLQNQLSKLGADEQRQAAALNALKVQRQALDQAEVGAAQARLKADQARLDVLRNQVTVARQQAEGARAGAVFAGGARPGELEAIKAAAEQARLHGFETLTDEQRALISSFGPQGQSFLEQGFQARGQNLPGFQEAFQALGGRGTLASLQEEQGRLEDQLRAATARIEADFKTTVAGVFQTSFGELGTIIGDALKAAVNKLRVDLLNQLFQAGLVPGINRENLAGQRRE